MKITLEVPDGTICGFFNYVFRDNQNTPFGGLMLGEHSLDSDDLEDGNVIIIDPHTPGTVTKGVNSEG